MIAHLQDGLHDERANRRFFAIGFKEGTVRAVYPSDEDPLRFEEQLLATGAGIVRLDESGGEEDVLEARRSEPR